MKRICIVAILLACSIPTFSQADNGARKWKHIAGFGYGLNQVKENNLHPKVSSGRMLDFTYGREKRTSRWQQLTVRITYSRVKTRQEDVYKSVFGKFSVQYAYGWPVYRHNNFSYYAGPSANLSYNITYFPNWDESHVYRANFLAAGIKNCMSFRLKNGNECNVFLSVPVFSLYSRPDQYRLYKIDQTDFSGITEALHSGVTPGFWNRAFVLELQAEYSFPVFTTRRESFIYSFDFLRMKRPGEGAFLQLSHQLGIRFYL